MMRKLTVLIIATAVLVTGCARDVLNTQPEVKGLESALPVQTLVEPESGASLTLRPGGQVSIELESNPTTGYFWYLIEGDATVAALKSDDYLADPAPEGLVGSGGKQVMVFEGVSSGTTTLVLSYQRHEEDVFEKRKIKIKVLK